MASVMNAKGIYYFVESPKVLSMQLFMYLYDNWHTIRAARARWACVKYHPNYTLSEL